MIERFLRWLDLPAYGVASPQERLLIVIIGAVLVLFIATVLFALVVLMMRARHARQRRRTEERESRWDARLLDVLGGEVALAELQRQVGAGEELDFLAYLLRFARRLRGEELRTIARIADPFMWRALKDLEHRSAERRAQAVQAVAAFAMQGNVAAVVAALDDPSPYVAVTAARALASREHAEHAAEVMRRLWRFTHWSTDYLSAMLANIGPIAAAPAREILGDASQPANARAVAADVLSRLNDPLGAGIAARVLSGADGNAWGAPVVQAAALRLLAQVGRAEHLPIARGFLTSRHGMVRGEAVRVVATLGGDAEVAGVQQALSDPSRWVAREAVRGLLRLGQVDLLRTVAGQETPIALVARQVLAEAGA